MAVAMSKYGWRWITQGGKKVLVKSDNTPVDSTDIARHQDEIRDNYTTLNKLRDEYEDGLCDIGNVARQMKNSRKYTDRDIAEVVFRERKKLRERIRDQHPEGTREVLDAKDPLRMDETLDEFMRRKNKTLQEVIDSASKPREVR